MREKKKSKMVKFLEENHFSEMAKYIKETSEKTRERNLRRQSD